MCRHPNREWVKVFWTEEIVGQVCADCFEALPVEYGCRDCTWVRLGSLQDAELRLVLAEPCEDHGGPPARNLEQYAHLYL